MKMGYKDKLREYRKAHKITQAEMAIRLGASYNAYLQWERGFNPSDKYKEKIDAELSKDNKAVN